MESQSAFDHPGPNVSGSSAATTPQLSRWMTAVCIIAVLIGLVLRFTHLPAKIFWGDEVYTALRVSGYTQADVENVYDGKVHSVAEIQKFQHLAPAHGIGDTVHSLVVDDPQHPPLFYVAERLWAPLAGDSPGSLRLLAALISVAALPLIVLVACELFHDARTGYIAAALLAVSPFHLLYAHEAREYSLWTVGILFSTFALLRAMRLNAAGAWVLYAAAVAFALYGDLLTVYVLAAHALWVYARNFRRPALLARFTLAAAAGTACFAVWIIRIWSHWHTFTSYMSWGNFRYPLKSMAEKWLFNAGAVLFDLEYVQLRLAIVAALGLVLLAWAVVYTARRAAPNTATLLALLGGVITAAIIGQDFHSGTYFSTIARYLTPLWLCLELALAFTLAAGFASRRRWLRDGTEVTFLLVLLCGAISGYVGGGSPAWWNNHINADARALAAVVNREDVPLLLSAYRPDPLLVLSHELRPDVHLLLFEAHPPAFIPAQFDTYDVLSPTPDIESEITHSGRFTIASHDYFLDTNSPIEQFHADLRTQQSSQHLRQRQTPQEFLVHLGDRGASNDDMPFHHALPSKIVYFFKRLKAFI